MDWRIKLRVAWKELSNDRIPMYIFTSDTTQSLDKFSFLGRGGGAHGCLSTDNKECILCKTIEC